MYNSVSEIYDDLQMQREHLDFDEFVDWLSRATWFITIVDASEEITRDWELKVGLRKSTKKDDALSSLSDRERELVKYFHDHSFPDPNDLRNVIDLVELLTGFNPSPHVQIKKQSSVSSARSFFPAWACVVPTGNPNSHDYRIGQPVMSYGASPVMLRRNGTTGNQLTTDIGFLRSASRDEIRSFLIDVLYTSRSTAERLLWSLETRIMESL